MKIAVSISTIFLLLTFSCQKFEWDLKRNNPNDAKNTTLTGGNQGNPSSPTSTLKTEFSKFEVIGDDNNNKKINVGETIELKVLLKNTGTVSVNSVTATFKTDNILANTLSIDYRSDYGDMAVNEEKYGIYPYLSQTNKYSLRLKISNSASIGSKIDYVVDVSDKKLNAYRTNFSLIVE